MKILLDFNLKCKEFVRFYNYDQFDVDDECFRNKEDDEIYMYTAVPNINYKESESSTKYVRRSI